MMLLGIAKRRKWLLLGSIVVAAIFGLVASLLMTPQYTATATLEIGREGNGIVDVRGVEQESGPSDLEFYQTQDGLLEARSLAERVATEMRLYQSANFFQMFGVDDVAAEILESSGSVSRADRAERVRRAADILLENINIAPTRMSRLVDVQFTSPDAAFSAEVANAWTDNFIELTLARRFEATSHARTFLEQRLAQLRQRLEESERALVGYASRQGIVNISSTTSSAAEGQITTERSLVAENLAALNEALNQAIADRTAAQARIGASGGSTHEALQNQAISTLRARRAELAADHEKLLSQFAPEYPPARAIQSQIDEIDRSIAREEMRIRNTIDAAYRAALAREKGLRGQVAQLEKELTNLRGRTIQYNIYQREVDTNRQLYDALLQRYKEIGVAGGVGVNNISVVDSAIVPENPSSPRLLLNLVLALLAGTAIGVGLAIALEQIDEGISDPKDVEKLMGLPLLGTIPKSETDPGEELEDRKSALVESYLSAQTSLAFSTDHGIPRTLAVTSSRPSEGKTTTSYALARSLARTGRQVILIDGDMRSPSLHNICSVPNTKGLSNFLAGDNDTTSIIKPGPAENLSLMTAGPTPPNAAELFVSDRLTQLTQKLLERFDHIVVDAPPVMGLADAPLIGSQVEGVIFVVESHGTRVSMAKVAVNRLRDAHARVLGILLTKFEARRSHYGYGYEYGYGYGESAKQSS
jgi:capsular exopolysaccharide synthesis family protein